MPPRSTGNHGGGYKGISAEGRRSLSEAMKARWAARKAEAAKAAKAAKRAPVNVKEHKGSMSAEGLESFKKAMKKSMTQRNAAARKLGYSNLVDYYRAVKAGTERRSITLTNSKAPKKNAAKKAAKVQHQEKQAA